MPLIVAPFALFVIGITWFLASLGVYVRDMSQIINMLVTVFMFLSPIFFPVAALPEQFQLAMTLNPLTRPIELIRDVAYWGVVPALGFLVYLRNRDNYLYIGFCMVSKTRKGFADVL